MVPVDSATAQARVQAGVAVLAGWDPNWRARLNASLLDMASGRFLPPHPDDDPDDVRWPATCGCVAAQWCYTQMGHPDAAGDYQDGVMLLLDKVGLLTDHEFQRWAVDHGLLAERQADGYTHPDPDLDAEYELLTRLWREEITRG